MSEQEQPYRKDLSHTTWDKVYERQSRRAAQAAEWLDVLALRPGDRVLDVGSGPGFISLLAARRVGPHGLVIAVDRAAGALAYLEQRQAEAGLANIQRVEGDARTLTLPGVSPTAALITMMLHHDDHPAGLLANLGRLLPPGARAVLAEFHPEGPCDHGPPRDHRIHPDQAAAWADAAGFAAADYRRQSPEHYMFLLTRTEA